MPAPNHPITLTPEQLEEINGRLSKLRHDVNNCLSMIVAATEVMRRKPEMAARFIDSLAAPPQRIGEAVLAFSNDLEKALQITRP